MPLGFFILHSDCLFDMILLPASVQTTHEDVVNMKHNHSIDSEDAPQMQPSDGERISMAMRQLEKYIDSMERLRLSEYIRYVDNRKRLLWSHFWGGVARGAGTAIGFTILGALLVLILQDLARRNLPLIGDVLAEIVQIVQRQLP